MAREEKEKKGFFSKLKESLSRTRDNLSGRVDQLVANYEELDDDFYDELLDILILADVGVKTSTMVVDKIKAEAREKKIGDPKQVKQMLIDILVDMMKDTDLRFPSPTVLMVIGVNGVGKTTTIGKLATRFQYIGRKVIICAGDTFRAAAADQLEIWAKRANTMIVRQHEGADPAAVLFDAIQARSWLMRSPGVYQPDISESLSLPSKPGRLAGRPTFISEPYWGRAESETAFVSSDCPLVADAAVLAASILITFCSFDCASGAPFSLCSIISLIPLPDMN